MIHLSGNSTRPLNTIPDQCSLALQRVISCNADSSMIAVSKRTDTKPNRRNSVLERSSGRPPGPLHLIRHKAAFLARPTLPMSRLTILSSSSNSYVPWNAARAVLLKAMLVPALWICVTRPAPADAALRLHYVGSTRRPRLAGGAAPYVSCPPHLKAAREHSQLGRWLPGVIGVYCIVPRFAVVSSNSHPAGEIILACCHQRSRDTSLDLLLHNQRASGANARRHAIPESHTSP